MSTEDGSCSPSPTASAPVGECDGGRRHLDRLWTPLNACSLEVLHRRLPSHGSGPPPSSDEGNGGGVLPLIIGCYQLNEGESPSDAEGAPEGNGDNDAGDAEENVSEGSSNGDGEGAAAAATRSGQLRLHLIKTVRSDGGAPPPPPLAFGEPAQVFDTDSGVLDGKWCGSAGEDRDGASAVGGPAGASAATRRYLYGTACASGRVRVYSLAQSDDDTDEVGWRLGHLASSAAPSPGGAGAKPLCLSLDWDLPPPRESSPTTASTSPRWSRRIVSSYSNGTLAVHNVAIDGSDAEVEEVRTWDAHRLFGVPAEVWTTCFAGGAAEDGGGQSDVVASGADDCTLKLWDLRTDLRRPTAAVGEEEYEAGVTAVARHPRLSHVLAAGSYDESVRLWDVRNMAEPLCRAQVGGGVWRVRWHPSEDGMMLVAAMHGGCRVVDFTGLNVQDEAPTGAASAEIVAEFKGHESMAYGADWLIPKGGVKNGSESNVCGSFNSSLAASCSFYDRQAFIWDGRI